MLWRRLLSLYYMNQTLLASDFPSAASLPLSAFVKLKRVRALLLSGLWLKRIFWLVWASIQATQTSSRSNKLFHKRPDFLLISAFCVPSALSLIIFSFWLKVRDMWLFLSLEHLEAPVRLLTGLISILLCLRDPGGLRRGRWGNCQVVEQSENTHLLSLPSYLGVVMVLQNNYNINIKEHWL